MTRGSFVHALVGITWVVTGRVEIAAAPKSLGDTSDTPEINSCQPRQSIGAKLARLPLSTATRTSTLAILRWLGIERHDAATEALEHFERAVQLYTQGDYPGAISEFVAAYCHAPQYLVLYNIAQAFERLARYERAVAYLNRYIRESPADADELREVQSFRVEVLQKLPARLRVATVPPGATVTLSTESGIVARGVANAAEPILARKGTYRMRIELAGYELLTRTISLEIGQPYSFYFQLKPQRGTLQILARPSDARIFINQQLVGVGRFIGERPIGAYRITAEARGRHTETTTAEVRAGERTSAQLVLQAKPKSGRRQLLIASTLGGGLIGGGTLASIFEQGTTEAAFGSLLGLGIGFAGGYFGVSGDITVGSSSYIIGSVLIAAAEAAMISAVFACESSLQLEGDFEQECNADDIGSAAVAGSVGGLLIGAATADSLKLSAGDAALVNSGALWGTVTGSLFVAAFGTDSRIREPLLLAGLNLGILSGSLLAARLEISRGHIALIDLSGLAGAVAGVATANIITAGDDSERVPHFALLGMTVGLITGSYLTRNMDEPKSSTGLRPNLSTALDANQRQQLVLGFTNSF